jgi:hypothetical protein
MNGNFPETYSVDPESTGQRPHDQIDNLIDEHEGSSLFNLLSFLTELAPGYSPLERMGEKETFLQKAGEVPTFLMGLGLLASPQGVRKTATKLGSRRVLKELGEEVADPLYHNTGLDKILGILKEGNLGSSFISGSEISFTRNPNLGGFGPAQIIVSKDKIKSLGRIRPQRFTGTDIEMMPPQAELGTSLKFPAEELRGGMPPFKHEAEEVFFTPQQRHLAIKGVERARTPKRGAKIPTEKFEGIRIDKFMFEDFPGDKDMSFLNWASEKSIERAETLGRNNPSQPAIEYITELMREAHKRKVPIILGPEATETFHNLNMEKKLPKAWLGRLVVDSDQIFFHGGPTKLKELKEGVLFSVSGAQEREHGARIADWGKDVLGKPAARRRKVKPIGGIAESYAEERSWRTSDGGAITALKLKPGVKLATYDEFEKVIKEIGMLDDYMSTTLSSAEWVSDTPLAIKALKDRGYHGVTDLPDFGFRGDFDEITSTMVFNAKESMEILPYSSKLPGS